MGLEKYRGFSRDAKLVVAYSFFGWLGGNIVWFILPFYFKSLGMGFTEIGTLFSISTIVQAILLLVSGQVSVKLGYKRTILIFVFYRSPDPSFRTHLLDIVVILCNRWNDHGT